MAIQVQGTTVIDDSSNITNIVSANVTSLSIGGTAVTASVSEINTQLSDVSDLYTIAEQIEGITSNESTKIVTLAQNEVDGISVGNTGGFANSTPVLSALKDVGGTLTLAIPGVDYTYNSTNDASINFKSLVSGNTDFQIRFVTGSVGALLIQPIYFGTVDTDVTTGITKQLTAQVANADRYLAFISNDLSVSQATFENSNYTTHYYANTVNSTSSVFFASSNTANTFTTAGTLSNSALLLIPSYLGAKTVLYSSDVAFNAQSLTSPADSCLKDETLLTALYLQDDNHTSITPTPPTGYTLVGSATDTSGTTGAVASVFVAQKSIIADGTETPGAWTYTGSSANILGAMSIRLRRN